MHSYGNNQFGLRDKYDQGAGLVQMNPMDKQYTLLENTIVIDSRNCIGKVSLEDAQVYARSIGKRPSATGKIITTSGLGTFPIVVTFDSVANLANDDTVKINGITGNTVLNGLHKISGIVGAPTNTALVYTLANGNYTGGGIWYRMEDSSYPMATNYQNIIKDNAFIINLEKNLKNLRTFTLHHIVIPRDIIPLTVYLPDFLTLATTDLLNVSYNSGVVQNYDTFIPQEKQYIDSQILGFFSTPLDIFRSYSSGNFSIPDLFTPPPLQLWNPPTGAWPDQPVPYPYQTVPTYRSNSFLIESESYYIVLSGYGVYDLTDWTCTSGTADYNKTQTEKMRKLLLILICQKQSYKNKDYIDLITSSNVTSNTDVALAFGFGDYQRYLPGPGVAQSYQPGTPKSWYTVVSGPPNVVQTDSPIPFPNFRGNVWGPYTSPGDRFQKLGIRSTLQDLYLNGDTSNLNGLPIVLPEVPTEDIQDHPLFGLNFASISELNLGNVSQLQNPNILNAMRIMSNGFGASNARALGSGTLYTTDTYVGASTAGGIGPSSIGPPVTWLNTGIYGAPTLNDPMAQGPLNGGLTPASASATDVSSSITNSISFFDFGVNNGQFVNGVLKYINYVVNELPDTDLIIKVEESLRDERVLTTDSFNSDCMLDCPIRLSLGSTSGTVQYIESLQSLVGNASEYWEKRYFNSKAELSMLHIKLFSYDGTPIPIEKMLQLRTSSEFLSLYNRVLKDMELVLTNTPFENFLFDPLNPELIGRVKRYMQIRFKVQCYEGTPPGLEPNSYVDTPFPKYINNNQFT